jgi:MinD superfamily P-loop ATPase
VKEITIISGKGGTGKTTIAAALASSVENLVLCDGDVDAPDFHLLLEPKVVESHVFEGNWVASVHASQCTHCGLCMEYCRFDAIQMNGMQTPVIDRYKCEGCRLCERICPSNAITSERSTNNHWFVSATRHGILVHARMGPGEENSGKLVTRVRQKARELAAAEKAAFILTDGPPGTGCPAIAAITGTDLALLVMEPTRTSLHDAQRVIELTGQFKIPVVALINKYDLFPGIAGEITKMLKKHSIPLFGRIPFDKAVVEAMVHAQSVTEFAPRSKAARSFLKVREELIHMLPEERTATEVIS